MIFPIVQTRREEIKIFSAVPILNRDNNISCAVVFYEYDNTCHECVIDVSLEFLTTVRDSLPHTIDVPGKKYTQRSCINNECYIKWDAELYVITDSTEKGLVKKPFIKKLFYEEKGE